MSLKGQCAICIVPFSQSCGKISALQCGHTFHFLCVTKWLEAKKECPNCRRRVPPKTGLIEKLFFDTITSDEPTNEMDYAAEAERLAVQLATERNSFKEAQERHSSMVIEVETLKKKLEKEKEKYKKHVTDEIPRIRALENLADSSDYYRKRLEEAEQKLKACKFYKLLTMADDKSADEELAKYIKRDGSVDTNQFISLMKKQNDSLNKKMKVAVTETEDVKRLNRELKRQLAEKDALIKKYEEDCPGPSYTEAPRNKRLLGILTGDGPAAKRVSLGFNSSADEFEVRKSVKMPPVSLKRKEIIDLNDFSIFEEKKEEKKENHQLVFDPEVPSTSEEPKKRMSFAPIDAATVSSLQGDESLNDFPSILVPSTINKRVKKADTEKKRVFPEDYRSPILAPKGVSLIRKTTSLEDLKFRFLFLDRNL